MDYTELLPPKALNKLIGSLQVFRARANGADSAAGQDDMRVMLAAINDAIAAAAPAIRKAERERAAAVFDLMRNRSLGAQSGDLSELSNVMLRQIAELGWGQAAEAIRALPEEP